MSGDSEQHGPRQSLFYLGGIDLPMPQARAVQIIQTGHALAELGCGVTLAVGRAPRSGLPSILASYGLTPHPGLSILALPTLRLPRPPIAALVHPRLAVWNWSYGLAAIAALRLLPLERRPRLVLARDPRLAKLFIQAQPFTGTRVVYEVHELFSTLARSAAPGEQAPPIRAPRLRRLEKAVLRDAWRIIALTDACKSLLIEELNVPSARVLVAPDAAGQVPEQLPPRSPNSSGVVYAGQLYPWKGVGTLIESLTLLPRVRLKIVGGLSATDSHTLALRKQVSDLGLAGRVRFTGFVPHVAVAAELAGAAVAVVPLPDNPMSRFFTSPLKLYEYMAAGLPIVASDLPALREVLRDGQNALLIPPDDPAALARAIERLLTDQPLADRLRTQAHADVRGRTWSARAASVLSFLRE